MSSDGRDERDEFVAESDHSTAADVIEAAPDDDGAVAGSIAPDFEVLPQAPTPENALFVGLGVYLTVLALGDAIYGVGPQLIVGAFVAVAAATAACYGVLARTSPDT